MLQTWTGRLHVSASFAEIHLYLDGVVIGFANYKWIEIVFECLLTVNLSETWTWQVDMFYVDIVCSLLQMFVCIAAVINWDSFGRYHCFCKVIGIVSDSIDNFRCCVVCCAPLSQWVDGWLARVLISHLISLVIIFAPVFHLHMDDRSCRQGMLWWNKIINPVGQSDKSGLQFGVALKWSQNSF